MNKKELTEADIRTKFITPALVGPDGNKWNVMTQLREEVFFTNGRVIVRGKTVSRGEKRKVDYLLFYKPNLPIAVVEAKDNNHSVGAGMPCKTVREDKVTSANHRFYPGQIVYSKIRPNLSKVVVVDFEGLCSADMYPIDALIDPIFLQRYMLSESFLIQAVKADTRVAMPKINQMELNAIAVPVPPMAEQRRIVVKVDELMAMVDDLESQLTTSRAAAATLLSAAVAELMRSQQSV